MGLFSIFWPGAPRRACGSQINRIPFKLACPFLPTMMWSCMAMPSGLAISTMAFVIWMSACEGVGSPEGWLCTKPLWHYRFDRWRFFLATGEKGDGDWGR